MSVYFANKHEYCAQNNNFCAKTMKQNSLLLLNNYKSIIMADESTTSTFSEILESMEIEAPDQFSRNSNSKKDNSAQDGEASKGEASEADQGSKDENSADQSSESGEGQTSGNEASKEQRSESSKDQSSDEEQSSKDESDEKNAKESSEKEESNTIETLKKEMGVESEQEAYKQALEAYKKNQEYQKGHEALADLMQKQPEMAKVMDEMMNGTPLTAALAKHVNLEEQIPKEGEEGYEEYQKAKKEREEQEKSAEKYIQTLKENEESSKKAFEDFAQDKDEQSVQSFLNTLFDEKEGIAQKIIDNKYDKELLNFMWKALEYDQAVENAKKQGKNEQIEAKKRDEDTEKGDGVKRFNSTPPEEKTEEPTDPWVKGIDEFENRQKF
jgi:triacylglycerol lipase